MSASDEYTDPAVLSTGVAEGWADPEENPEEIDWAARQAAAAIPFDVADGRPVSPFADAGPARGRNGLGRWGENLMADALVTVTCEGTRYLLMVLRGDGRGWAVPGGAVEEGETGMDAALRELEEETGLAVKPSGCWYCPARHVPDPRASCEAWAVTIPVRAEYGGDSVAQLPRVRGGDAAAVAAWVPVSSGYFGLQAALRVLSSLEGHEGPVVFSAHEALLLDFTEGKLEADAL